MTVISGYAATFDRPDAQADLIRPGAFRTSLVRRAGRIPLLWQHDIAEPIGKILALREDARGLWFQAELPDSRRANDAASLIVGGALRECSIGFLPRRISIPRRISSPQRFSIPQGISPRRVDFEPPPHDPNRPRIRIIEELELIEISLVTLAANPAARLLSIDGAPLESLPPPPDSNKSALGTQQRLRDKGPPNRTQHALA